MAKRYNDLIRLDKHPHFYVNPASKKITYRKTQQGKTVVIRTGETTIQAAKFHVEMELEKRRTGASETSIRRRRQGSTNPTTEEIWNEFLPIASMGKERSTKMNYQKSWRHGFGEFWKDKRCTDLTGTGALTNLAKYKEWYLKTRPTRHFHHTLVHFQMLLKYMVERSYIPAMPDLAVLSDLGELVEKKAKRHKVGRVYTDDEIKALEAVHEKFLSERHRNATTSPEALSIRIKLGVRLGLVGLRKMEMLKLKRKDLNFKTGVVAVWSQKNNGWRQVPMTDDMRGALKEQLAVTGESEWLFPMATDPTRHLSSQLFDKVWTEARQLAEIQSSVRGGARFHDLRHTFATWTAEQGWPPRVACEVLDMSLRIYEKVYSKPRLDSKKEWMERTFGPAEDET